MQGVKCKLCGGYHSPGGAHIWGDQSKRPASPNPQPKPPPPSPSASPPATKRGRGRPTTGFDKKAYQRELMRKRRAKA